MIISHFPTENSSDPFMGKWHGHFFSHFLYIFLVFFIGSVSVVYGTGWFIDRAEIVGDEE